MDSNDKLIRRIRKKLRQIEHLQLLDRELNEEERIKVYLIDFSTVLKIF